MRPRPCQACPGAARRGRDAKHPGGNTDCDPNRRKDRRLSPTGPVRHRHLAPAGRIPRNGSRGYRCWHREISS